MCLSCKIECLRYRGCQGLAMSRSVLLASALTLSSLLSACGGGGGSSGGSGGGGGTSPTPTPTPPPPAGSAYTAPAAESLSVADVQRVLAEAAAQAALDAMFDRVWAELAPRPPLSILEWAETYRVMAGEETSRPGPYSMVT